jgi:hypothetical protein
MLVFVEEALLILFALEENVRFGDTGFRYGFVLVFVLVIKG